MQKRSTKIENRSNNIHDNHNQCHARDDKHDRGGHPHHKPETILRERLSDAAFPYPTTFAYGAAHVRNHCKWDGHKPSPKYEVNTIKYWTSVTKGAKAGTTQTGGSPIERVLEQSIPATAQRSDGKTKNTNRTESKTYSHLEGADDFAGADGFSDMDTLEPIFQGDR
jgi:hypothetical protein